MSVSVHPRSKCRKANEEKLLLQTLEVGQSALVDFSCFRTLQPERPVVRCVEEAYHWYSVEQLAKVRQEATHWTRWTKSVRKSRPLHCKFTLHQTRSPPPGPLSALPSALPLSPAVVRARPGLSCGQKRKHNVSSQSFRVYSGTKCQSCSMTAFAASACKRPTVFEAVCKTCVATVGAVVIVNALPTSCRSIVLSNPRPIAVLLNESIKNIIQHSATQLGAPSSKLEVKQVSIRVLKVTREPRLEHTW